MSLSRRWSSIARRLKAIPTAAALFLQLVEDVGGGTRSVAATLGARQQWRGPAHAHRRRTGHRQVAPRGGVSRDAWRDAPHLCRTVVVAALAEYAFAPDRRMGPTALRRG